MSNRFTQQRGVMIFGGTDFSTHITTVAFQHARGSVEIPQTFGSDETDSEPGALTTDMEITFLDPMTATSFHAALRPVIEDDGEITFDTLFDNTAAGSSNPRRTGTVIVTSLNTGGEVGGLRTQSQTYRVKAGTFDKTTV